MKNPILVSRRVYALWPFLLDHPVVKYWMSGIWKVLCSSHSFVDYKWLVNVQDVPKMADAALLLQSYYTHAYLNFLRIYRLCFE